VAAWHFIGGHTAMTSGGDRELEHLRFMLESIDLALSYIDGFAFSDFLEDKRTQQAVILNLLHLGEAANRLMIDSDDIGSRYSHLPWNQMRGMRNRLAHGYFDINLDVVWSTLQNALPELRKQLRTICQSGD
jgi:uncharacterized protein with HEPN domain